MSESSRDSDTNTNTTYNLARRCWTFNDTMLDSSTMSTSTMGRCADLGTSPNGRTPKLSAPFALGCWLKETQSLYRRLYLWGDEEAQDCDEGAEATTALEAHGSRERPLAGTAPATRCWESSLKARLDVNLLGIGAWVDGHGARAE